MSSIISGVFIAYYFNTGFVLLLSSANLKETYIPFFKDEIQGQYTDFSDEWYRDIGINIIKTMIINSFMPLIEFLGFWGLATSLRFLDNGFTNN